MGRIAYTEQRATAFKCILHRKLYVKLQLTIMIFMYLRKHINKLQEWKQRN